MKARFRKWIVDDFEGIWASALEGTQPESEIQRRPTSTLATLSLLFALSLLSRLVRKTYLAPHEVFESHSIAVGMLMNPSVALIPIIVVAAMALDRRNVRWEDIYNGTMLRVVIVAAATSLLVTAVFHSPNYYFESGFYWDRGLLVILFAAIWFRPAMAAPFAVYVMTTSGQFEYPIGDYTLTHKLVLIHALLSLGLMLSFRAGRTARSIQVFFTCVVTLFVLYYFTAGIQKVLVGWVSNEDAAALTIATHVANGWLSAEAAELAVAATNTGRPFIIGATLIVEIGAGLMLLGRRAFLVWTPLVVALHFGIFLLSGINFITSWVVLLGAVAFYAIRTGGGPGRAGPVLLLGLIPLAFFAQQALGTYRLAWIDTPLVVSYHLEGTGESGASYRIPKSFMDPYDFAFAHGYYAYLSPVPLLSFHGLGITADVDIAELLASTLTRAELVEAEAANGVIYYDQSDAEAFDRLIRARFLKPEPGDWPNLVIHEYWVGSPPEIAGRNRSEVYVGQEPISEVAVLQVKHWFDGQEAEVMSTCVLRVISIDNGKVVEGLDDRCESRPTELSQRLMPANGRQPARD